MDLTGDIELPVPVDSCHAIVLGSAPRRVESYERLVASCPEIKRHKAVEGKDAHALSHALKDLGVRLATDVWQATVGQVACLCSHAQLWRRFAHCPKPFFVVLEDDAVLPNGPDAFREAVDQVCRARHVCATSTSTPTTGRSRRSSTRQGPRRHDGGPHVVFVSLRC